MSDDHRIIYGLRILVRKTREFVEVFGADQLGPIPEGAGVYENSPYDTYAIQRLTADIADYLQFEDSPGVDAPAQAWAEYIWAPRPAD